MNNFWFWSFTGRTRYILGRAVNIIGAYIRPWAYNSHACPMQCVWNSGCFPWGKRAAIVQCYPASATTTLPLCAVFSCFHTTDCEASFTTDGYGIFNVHTNLGTCRTHKGGSGTNKSAQVDLEGQKTVSYPAPPWDWGSNPGSSDLNSDSDHWATPPPSWATAQVSLLFWSQKQENTPLYCKIDFK